MYLLDTNVISEVMRPSPDPLVINFLDSVDPPRLHLSAITVAEVRAGLELLDAGGRRERLADAFNDFLDRGFSGRVLAFDHAAAGVYGGIIARRSRAGRPIPQLDAQMAAIASVHACTVVTRNVGDFDDSGVEVLNPFDTGSG